MNGHWPGQLACMACLRAWMTPGCPNITVCNQLFVPRWQIPEDRQPSGITSETLSSLMSRGALVNGILWFSIYEMKIICIYAYAHLPN